MNENTINTALDTITREAAADICIYHVAEPTNAAAVLRLVHALRAAMNGELDGIVIAKIAEVILTSTSDTINDGRVERIIADNMSALVAYYRDEDNC